MKTNSTTLAYRVTGDTGNFKILNRTSDTFNPETTTVQDDDINDSRQLSDDRLVGLDAAGTVEFQLRADTYDIFLAAAMATTAVTTGGDPDPTVDTYKIGKEQPSFEIIKTFNFPDGTVKHAYFEGMQVDTFNITVPTRDKITGSIGFVGTTVDLDYDASGITFDAAPTQPVIDGSNNIGTVSIEGVTGAVVKQFSIDFNNNLEAVYALDSQTAVEQDLGEATAEGSAELRFSPVTYDLYKSTITNAEVAISFGIVDDNGITYDFSLPRCKLSSDLPSGSKGDTLNQTYTITPLYHDVSGSSVIVTKTTPAA